MSEDNKPIIDDETILKILEENKERVRTELKAHILDGIKQQFKWQMPDLVQKAVAEFMREEVVPEIQKQLLEDKTEIINAATLVAAGMAQDIGKALQEDLACRLTDSWKRKKILEALFV